ncbi:MAG TPA: NTPase (NACHT family), partial [Cyanobacteria bacterium UBA11049]|nr:NTPase (NACHT family) [Cyanobacteria bacterium UBA11049]
MSKRAGRSLKASPAGINQVKNSLRNFGSKLALADELEISRATVQKFFVGKPIGRENFHKICQRLNLSWQAIADLPAEDESFQEFLCDTSFDLTAVVNEWRQKARLHIESRCGMVRVLDMSQPIDLNDIYTNVNILEKITGRRRLGIAELLQNCGVQDFERFGLSGVTEKRVPGLEAVKRYSKLMVLGKPGAGKTTFLKYLAMQCIEGNFQANRVPLFITLKEFAEAPGQPELLTYLSLWDGHLARPRNGADRMSTPQDVSMLKILHKGRALLLLDGLDEVREEDTKRVLRQIQDFSDQFHTNQYVITCRIAAKEYTFERFTEVEVADFDEEQIAIFAQNWFRSQENPSPTLPELAGRE